MTRLTSQPGRTLNITNSPNSTQLPTCAQQGTRRHMGRKDTGQSGKGVCECVEHEWQQHKSLQEDIRTCSAHKARTDRARQPWHMSGFGTVATCKQSTGLLWQHEMMHIGVAVHRSAVLAAAACKPRKRMYCSDAQTAMLCWEAYAVKCN